MGQAASAGGADRAAAAVPRQAEGPAPRPALVRGDAAGVAGVGADRGAASQGLRGAAAACGGAGGADGASRLSAGKLIHTLAGAVNTKLTHPVDDPTLPSFVHPILADLQEDLQRAYDAYHYLRGVKSTYLPKEPAEPPEAYEARLSRAVFGGFFASSVEAFAGALSRYSLIDPPDSFNDAVDNIDLEGNSLAAWFMQADSLMLRDGGVWLQVEMPPGRVTNAAEEVAAGRRPYLVMRPRAKGLNWRSRIVDGVERLERVTFLEMVEVEDGGFGVTFEPRYRVVTASEWLLFQIETDAKGQATPVVVDQGQYLGANGQPLPIPPVIWYPSEQAGHGQGGLPLRQVVEHSIEHFQMRSDLAEKTHKCAMPVPVAIGRTPPAPGEARRPLVIGPNSVVDLDPGGSFSFAEPSADSLAEQRAQIGEVEKLIARQTLGFLYGDGGGTKTATQAGLEAAQTQAGITRLGQRKASAIQSLMMVWCMFTGEQLDVGAGLQMSSTIYEKPLEPQDVAQLQSLAGGVELISQQSAVEILQRAGVNTATTSVDDELERIRGEMPDPAEEVGINDLGMLPGLLDRQPDESPTDTPDA